MATKQPHERGTKTTYPRPDYRKGTTDAEAIKDSSDETKEEK
jgi:hypothetical protein